MGCRAFNYSFLKGQCHEIFVLRFFCESFFPKPLRICTIKAVSIFSKIRGDIRSPRSTGWQIQKIFNQKSFNYFFLDFKFTLKCPANLPPASLIPVVYLSCEYLREFLKKLRMTLMFFFWGLGEDDS